MTIRTGSHTPWGSADDVVHVAEGICNVGTPSHGGMHVDPPLNSRIHSVWRNSDGWYEEDCEANIVVATFPEAFATRVTDLPKVLTTVHDALAYWFPAQHRVAFPVQAAQRAGRETSDDVMARLKAEAAARNAAAQP